MRITYLLFFWCLPALSFQIDCKVKHKDAKGFPKYVIKSDSKNTLYLKKSDENEEEVMLDLLAESRLQRSTPVKNSSRFGLRGFVFVQALKSSTGSVGYVLVETQYQNSVHVKSALVLKLPMREAEALQTDESDGDYLCTLSE